MSKVKTVESAAEFQALVTKSGLFDGDKLEAVSQICRASEDPKVTARQLVKDGFLTNWQASQLLGGFSALIVGNYKLLDQIGKGELGRVYLAEHVKMGNKVALKALASKSASDPKLAERFVAEARAAGAFEHRNVLRVLDVATEQDRPYVVTEYVSGGDLQQRVEKSGPLPPRDAADFVAQSAEGMNYVHGRSVLHRDLKPANLLVDDRGVVKILDVGVGQLRQAEKPNTENTGELLLSALGYMSPEQVRGKDLDARSDIYALGGTLYFLLTARVPYTAASNEERDVIRKTKRPVPVSTLKPDIPLELARLCDQMMALKSMDRPPSMDNVAQQLRRYLQGESEIAPAMPAEPKSSDTVQRTHADTVQLNEAIAADLTTQIVETEPAPSPTSSFGDSGKFFQEDHPPREQEIVRVTVDGVLAGPTPAASVPTGFKIQKKKKAAITEAVASSAEADSALAAVAKKAKRQRTNLLATAGVSLLVILIGVGVMVMLSGDSAPQVAQNQGAASAEVGDAGATPSAPSQPGGGLDPNDPENLPDPASTADKPAEPSPAGVALTSAPAAATPSTATPAIGAVPDPTATAPPPVAAPSETAPPAVVAAATPPLNPPATPPVAAASTPPVTAPASTPGAAPAPTPAAPATPAPVTAAAPTGPAPTGPAQPATAAPATPAPAAPASVAPTAEPKKEEPKPEPPKPAPAAPPPAPKSGKTFEIAASVDLPRLPSTDGSTPAEAPAKVLGKINLDPKDACFIAVLGGDKSMRGRHSITLRNAQSGTAPRDWEVVQKDPTGTEVVIATLALPTQELKFEWTPGGLKHPAASALRNCALKITAGQEKPQIVALRTVTKAPPVLVENLERSNLSAKFNLDAVPDSSALRLEPSIEGQKIAFDAGGPDITKGNAWIYFGENKDQAPLGLKLDTSVTAKGIQISAVPHVLIPNEKPQKLTPALRKKLSASDFQRQSSNLTMQLDTIKKMNKEDQAKLQNEFNLTKLAQDNLDKLIQRVKLLDELIQKLNGSGKIHFRVFYDAGETQVNLVKTDDSAPPASK